MSNEKVIEMVEAENNSQENVVETKEKKKLRDTKVGGFFYRHRKIGYAIGGGAVALMGLYMAEKHKIKKNAAEAQAEAERAEQVENWFQNILLEAHESSGNEPAVDVEITPAENE